MDKQQAQHLLDELKKGILEVISVEKEDFMTFREVLTKREDFKHFRGTALRGGGCMYQYTDEPRS
ncbi:hypothetical protein GCM10008967_13900 [Bacillus carboniphilus]|uniref:Abortive phage infection protein n=1 Tax=Bacillus carboniphilus TaxID=86663 RepID=A0ABN0W426_9BACI